MPTSDSTVIRDGNRKTILWGLSSVDGTTLVPIQVDSVSGGVMAEDGVSVMPVMANLPLSIPRDGNRATALTGVSNASSNVFIPVSVNPANGALQIQST